MHFRLVEMSPDRLDHERIWGGIGLVVGLGVLVFPLGRVTVRCVFKALTGWPCPTCGMTRSLIHLRQLDLVGAFLANPLIATFALFAIAYVLYAWVAILFGTRRIRLVVTRSWEPTLLRVLAVAVVLGNWIYLIAVGR